MKQIVLSGIRATGKMHLGNYLGAMRNFVELQDQYDCFFFVADYHTLTTAPDPEALRQNLPQIVLDYLAVGLDPQKCVLFAQSSVPEVTELALLLGMLMSMGELQRCPTFKEKAKSQPDNVNFGLLGYPVLMAADILAPKADLVPVGKDQLPHIEMTRSLVKKFNKRYGLTFPVPRAIEEKAIVVPGLDGTSKMGKNEGNTIDLTDNPERIKKKISVAVTDPARIHRNDVGDPKNCNLCSLHEFISPDETIQYIRKGCQTAEIGCVECKSLLAEEVIKLLSPFQEKRNKLMANPDFVFEVLHEGGQKARSVTQKTVEEVREKMGLVTF